MLNQNSTTGQSNNNKILELEHKTITFLSKEEAANQCLVSPATFQNWLNYQPANEHEFEIGKNNKKLYKSDYVERLNKKYSKGVAKTGEPVISQVDNLWQKIIDSKDDRIRDLENQNNQLNNQLNNQWSTNQNLFEMVKMERGEKKFLENQLKTLMDSQAEEEKTPKNWLFSLLASIFNSKKKKPPNDN